MDEKKEIQTCKADYQTVKKYVDATGIVQADIEGGAKVMSPVSGVFSRVLVSVGSPVKKGTPLAIIKSAEVTDVYSNYLSILSQLKQAERMYNLNKQLFDIGAVTKNDLISSQATLEQQKALSLGLKKKLDLYGVKQNDSSQDFITLASPSEGFVAEIQAHIGDRLDSSTSVMTVANPDKIVIVANVSDANIQKIAIGQQVSFGADIFPNRVFTGRIKYISHVEDSDSKTVKTYISLANDGGLFRHNAFIELRIFGGETKNATISTSSIIYKDSKFYVMVKGTTGFVRKEIRPLSELPDRRMAVDGLNDGDEIACSAINMEKP